MKESVVWLSIASGQQFLSGIHLVHVPRPINWDS
jgi:hypothetical protein